MTERTPPRDVGRRQSDVLDAIFDVVEDKPEVAANPATAIFRAQALEQIDVPMQVDNLLPLTSRRFWLALVGTAIVIAAGLLYAGGVVQTKAVVAPGRAVAAPGIAVAASPVGQVLTSTLVQEGDTVTAGQAIAEGVDSSGATRKVSSPITGTVWQQLGTVGQVVGAGATVATLLPAGSDTSLLVAIPEADLGGITTGMLVNVTEPDAQTTGRVASITSAPIPADVASQRLGVTLDGGQQYVLATVTLDTPLVAGSDATAQIVIAQETLLQQLAGLS